MKLLRRGAHPITLIIPGWLYHEPPERLHELANTAAHNMTYARQARDWKEFSMLAMEVKMYVTVILTLERAKSNN